MPTGCARRPQSAQMPTECANIDFFKSLLGHQNDFKLVSLAREIPLIFIGLAAHPVGTVAHPVGVWHTLWAFAHSVGILAHPVGILAHSVGILSRGLQLRNRILV